MINSKYYFTTKPLNKIRLTRYHSSDINFMKIFKECSAERHFLILNISILPSDNPLHFGKS